MDGVVADDLPGPPRVFREGEAGIELVLRGALAHPREHPRLVLVGERVVRVALGRSLAEPGGHAEGVGERDALPAVVVRGDRHIVGDARVEDRVAVLLGQAEQRDRRAHGLRDREDAVAHLAAVRVGAVSSIAAADVEDAVDDEAAGADVVEADFTVDAVEQRSGRRRQGRPGPHRRLPPELLVEARAKIGLAGDGAGRVRQGRPAPVVVPLPRLRLLDELEGERGHARVVEEEGGEAVVGPVWSSFTETNGNDARDIPWSPGSDHTRPGDTITVPGCQTIPRSTGTSRSPCVKNSTENAGVRDREAPAAAMRRRRRRRARGLPFRACRAGAAAPSGMK